MPIIIDNSLLQQPSEEPDDDSAFGYAMMGLVDGIGAGIEKQRAQQEEQAAFEREKSAKLDMLQREQAFKKELFGMEQEANRPLLEAQLRETGLKADKAALDLEAGRQVAIDLENQRRQMFRTKYAEAFGDGDVKKGNEVISTLEDKIVESESKGDKKTADALRVAMTKDGERRFGEYQARRSEEYTGRVLSSDLFTQDESLKMEAQSILNRSDLSVVQKGELIRDLEKTATSVFQVNGQKTVFQTEVSAEITRLAERKNSTDTDEEEDMHLQSQINELIKLQGQASLVPRGDTKAMQDLITFGRQVMFQDPRQASRAQSGGGRNAASAAAESLKAELENLDMLMMSGAIEETKLQAAYQAAFDKAYGTGGVIGVGAPAGGQDQGASIRNFVMAPGGGDLAYTGDQSIDARKARVAELDKKEKESGLSVKESKLRDQLQSGIETEEKGGKTVADTKQSAKDLDASLKGIDSAKFSLDLKDVGRIGKFSLSTVENQEEAQEIIGHLQKARIRMVTRLKGLGVARGSDAAGKEASALYTELDAGINSVDSAVKALKLMMKNGTYPGAGG